MALKSSAPRFARNESLCMFDDLEGAPMALAPMQYESTNVYI